MRYRLARSLLGLVLIASAVQAQPEPESDLDALLSLHVTSASRLEQTTLRAPASVTVITADQIRRFGYRTLAEALASVPGLYLSYDRNYSHLGVRGFSRPTDYNTRVLVLVDGYRLNEDVYGYAPLGTDLPIDLRAVDRIEVVRGPGSVAFGTGAMLAVVNLILRQPGSVGDSNVAFEVGSHGRRAIAAHGGVEGRSGVGVAWSVSAARDDGEELYFPEYDAPETAHGRTSGADTDRSHGATAVVRYGELELTALGTRRQKRFPTGAWDTTFADTRARTTDSWAILGLRWNHALRNGVSLTLGGQAGHYTYDGVYPDGDVEPWMDSTDNVWWGNDLQLRWEQSPSHRLIGGVEYRNNGRADYRSGDLDDLELSFDANEPFHVLSAYVEDELQLGENVLVTTGVRHDSYPWAGSSTNPRLAVVYLPTRDTSIKLLHGRAFRAPNLYETRFDDPQFGIKGNSALRPEVVHTTELIVQRRLTESLLLAGSLFSSRLHGLIEQRLDDADGLMQYQNTASAASQGMELGFELRCCRGLLAFGSASLQRTTDEESDARLSNSPARLFKLGLSAPLRSDLEASVELTHESARLTVQDTSTDSFLLANALLAWRPRQEVRLELQVRNLLDSDYAYPGGPEHRQAAIAQDGRSFTVRCGATF